MNTNFQANNLSKMEDRTRRHGLPNSILTPYFKASVDAAHRVCPSPTEQAEAVAVGGRDALIGNAGAHSQKEDLLRPLLCLEISVMARQKSD